MTKTELRKIYLEKRQTLSKDEVLSLSERVYKNFVQFFQQERDDKIHVFLSIEKFNELDTSLFIDYFFRNSIQVFVPRIKGESLEIIQIFPETEYTINNWGIAEPQGKAVENIEFNCVLVPLLYCDQHGNRVGYGKGFYDRFFKKINTNALKVGVNFFPPSENIDDFSEFDIPLDYLVTPTEVLSFGGFTSNSTK